ncbi:MAG: ScyD/ScyE family protein [Luteitalea sp.]|nr:ScyD/ScyE family protein [Luteitalea sp.]
MIRNLVCLRFGIGMILGLSVLAGSAAAQPNVTVVMSELDNPRGLAFGPDGALYVVEAGRGGEGPCQELRGAEQCYGATGRVSRLWQGEQQQVVGELPSYAAESGEATGPHDISFFGNEAYVTIGFGADPELRADFGPAGAFFGTLLQVAPSGQGGIIADVAQYEADADPDQAGPDSNPYGLLAEADNRLVVDAGGNDLVSVDAAGDITTFAVLPENPVPTAVAIGPDGAYYVGVLTGVPFAEGEAQIFRVVPDEEPTVFLEDFTTIVDLAFGPDGSLYVLQHATGSGFADPGQLIRVGRDGTRSVVVEDLVRPTSVALGPDGTIYVTNNAVSIGGGEVLQITLPYTRYFAEGAVGDFFDTTYALFNPGDTPVTATLRFANETGDVLSHVRTIPAGQQVTVDVDPLVPPSWVGVAAVIEADQPLVTSRTVSWGQGPEQGPYGGDTGAGVASPLPEWWITEGATGVYSLFYLLHNPGDQPAEIEITYFRPGGQAPVTRSYTVGAQTRRTILVNSADGMTPDPELGNTAVSAHIVSTNDVPVVAERAMYLDSISEQPFTAGTLAAAVPLASDRWTFAEGATGFFNLFLLLANPTTEEVEATVRYLLPASEPIEKVYTLDPMSRQTLWVNEEDAQLTDTTVAIEVVSSAPITAERAMWWGASGVWDAGHVSTGVGQAALKWALAGLGTAPDEVAYILLANPNAEATEARLTLAFEDDTEPLEATVPLAAGSRVTVQLADLFPAAAGARAAVTVESAGDMPLPLVVEGTAYGSPSGQPLTTGRAVPALPLASIP